MSLCLAQKHFVRLLSTQKIPAYTGPSYNDVQRIRKNSLNPAIKTFYRKPLLIHSGQMQFLYDNEGKQYLDLFGGIVTVSVGHCHPRINQALEQQMRTLWHTTNIYMTPKVHEYAEKLIATLPPGLDNVFFTNSGSEANDIAMLMSRLYTGNFEILSFRNAYHGASPYTMGLTAHGSWRYPVAGLNNGVTHVMNPDPFAGIWGGAQCRDSPVQTTRECTCAEGTCEASENYLKQLEETLKHSMPQKRMAGMFAESIQGVGGTVQFPKGYIKRAVELIRENGGLFVSDEVQTGFGRTGEHFWGFEGHGIVPDIVTMAKGIGNGFPLGAVVTRKEIAESMMKAAHFNTFGGNPLASTVGSEVLDIIKDEKLQENSLDVGTYFLKGLEALRDQYNVIGDVRGKGLMIGVEFVQSQAERTPLDRQQFGDIWEHTKELGVLFGSGGLHGNIMRIKPPMCITKADVDMGLDVLKQALDVHKKKHG